MSEMVERVAKVLAHIESVEVDDEHLMMARAAIKALREPTEAMLQVSIPKSGSFDDCYRAMISAALPQEGGER